MTADEERWIEALAIDRLLGPSGSLWITERICALELAGDAAGVEQFKQVAAKFELMSQRRQPS